MVDKLSLKAVSDGKATPDIAILICLQSFSASIEQKPNNIRVVKPESHGGVGFCHSACSQLGPPEI